MTLVLFLLAVIAGLFAMSVITRKARLCALIAVAGGVAITAVLLVLAFQWVITNASTLSADVAGPAVVVAAWIIFGVMQISTED